MAASGQSSWPPAGSFMAVVTGQFLVDADNSEASEPLHIVALQHPHLRVEEPKVGVRRVNRSIQSTKGSRPVEMPAPLSVPPAEDLARRFP
jgi:hypothetical protein